MQRIITVADVLIYKRKVLILPDCKKTNAPNVLPAIRYLLFDGDKRKKKKYYKTVKHLVWQQARGILFIYIHQLQYEQKIRTALYMYVVLFSLLGFRRFIPPGTAPAPAMLNFLKGTVSRDFWVLVFSSNSSFWSY